MRPGLVWLCGQLDWPGRTPATNALITSRSEAWLLRRVNGSSSEYVPMGSSPGVMVSTSVPRVQRQRLSADATNGRPLLLTPTQAWPSEDDTEVGSFALPAADRVGRATLDFLAARGEAVGSDVCVAFPPLPS